MYGRFPILTDEHISYALVKALRKAGWPTYRVEDEKPLGKRTPDARVFAYAAECGWVWLSRDARALRHDHPAVNRHVVRDRGLPEGNRPG